MTAPLVELIREHITRNGPLTFDTFMELALYHPDLGYYASRAPGAGTGYRTSPSLGPWFGRLLARAFDRMWRALGKPSLFTVVEVGAGAADLAATAIDSAEEPFASALRWHLVEPFPAVERLQRQRLQRVAHSVAWSRSLRDLAAVEGCVLANEVLDNLPVHLLEVESGRAREICVALEDGRLVESPRPVFSPALEEAATTPLALLDDGARFEVCLGFHAWAAEAAGALARGYLLVIDYGDSEPGIWTRRPAGTLVTYREEQIGFDLLAHPGLGDITAHVNFSALERAVAAAGMQVQRLAPQRDFLAALGVAGAAEELHAAEGAARASGLHGEALALLAERSRLASLTAPGLGDMLALLAASGAAPPVL
ncbi:MAG: class I SAM-dependent methyltransferase [Actinomycetota bacterium]